MVNPVRRPLQLGKIANRGLIKDQMRTGDVGMGVLTAVLLVEEGRTIAQASKNFGERRTISYLGFGFDHLVHAGRVFIVRVPLVGHDVAPAILTNAENLATGLQIAIRSVV